MLEPAPKGPGPAGPHPTGPVSADPDPTDPDPTDPHRVDPDPSDPDPSGRAARSRVDLAVLCAVQRAAARPALVTAARGMSRFGEHGLGWVALGALAGLVDRPRRRQWTGAAVGVLGAHACSVAVKQVVRRRRPSDPRVRVLVGAPSALSFPSAHATSTTAAAVLYGRLTGRRLVPLLVPPMLASRLVLGVHYPSDVVVGSALGAAVAMVLPCFRGPDRAGRTR